MNKIWLFLFLLSHHFCAFAAQKDSLWAEANKAYSQKQYDVAINVYESLSQQENENANLYYNLGNAYYRANKVSNAALNYERALFFNPQFNQAKDNLLLAQSRIPNSIKKQKSIFFIEWWNRLTVGHLATVWAILALLVFILSLVSVLLKTIEKIAFTIPAQSYFVATLLLVLFLVLGMTAGRHATHSNKAVVMTDGAVLYNWKGYIVPQATTVEIEKIERNRYKVSLPDKRTGWMKKSDLSRVQPEEKK